MFVNILSCILSEETLHQLCVPPTLVLETSEDPGSLKAMWPSGPMPPMNSSIPPAWCSIEKQSSFSFYVLINNKKETSPQQSSVRSQHTPRLNQERCRPERARSRKVLVQSQKSHFTFGSMSMCLKKFCNMYLWYFVWSYQFFVKVTCGSSRGDLPRCRRTRPCWTSSRTWSSLFQPCAPKRHVTMEI